MQSVGWYVRRLRGMSASEVAWRMRSVVRDAVDRGRVATGRYPSAEQVFGGLDPATVSAGFRVSDLPVGAWARPDRSAQEASWLASLLPVADALVGHRFTFFDLSDRHLGDPIDWNRDHSAGKPAPKRFAPSIDYRDFYVTGDCKLVWEPNRHHQLAVLGRAYRATGDARYSAAIEEQLASWLDACPFGVGMNWRSPLELAIRLINWVWALGLVEGAALRSPDLRRRVLHSAYLHLWDVRRKYSRGSSANNHAIGEAAGVFIGASYFRGLPQVASWRRQAREILEREIVAQTYADGFTREQAVGYHYFVLQFLLLAGLVARWTGEDFPPAYWARIESMMNFAAALIEGGPVPMIGDADDGYVLDLGGPRGDFRPLLAVGAVLFDRPDLKALAGPFPEGARWLLGAEAAAKYASSTVPAQAPLVSRAFPDSGYYLLQFGAAGSQPAISVIFDCGELGFGSISAHGHADALSVVVRAFGKDVLVDPGTYDYFTHPQWRSYFRSTAAHNTIEVDGEDQSVMLGPFLWGERARSRCLSWAPSPTGGFVEGEHHGYARLSDPVVHRRRLSLDGERGELRIEDTVEAKASHEVSLAFHFSECCEATLRSSNVFNVAVDGGQLSLHVDERLKATLVRGENRPDGGWVSRGYHRKDPATIIRASGRFSGQMSFVTRLVVESPPRSLS